jgi:hypothetical protein
MTEAGDVLCLALGNWFGRVPSPVLLFVASRQEQRTCGAAPAFANVAAWRRGYSHCMIPCLPTSTIYIQSMRPLQYHMLRNLRSPRSLMSRSRSRSCISLSSPAHALALASPLTPLNSPSYASDSSQRPLRRGLLEVFRHHVRLLPLGHPAPGLLLGRLGNPEHGGDCGGASVDRSGRARKLRGSGELGGEEQAR